jgi:dipeptidyl aminopeptidase/acylaminoacyl peptidase
MKFRVSSLVLLIMLLSLFQVSHSLYAEETKAKAIKQSLDQWLVLGPAQVPELSKDILGGNKGILDYKHLAIADLNPVAGQKVPWTGSATLQWTALTHAEFNAVETGVIYLATYLEPSRWLETTLHIHSTNLGAAVFLDGKATKEKLKKDKISTPLTLTKEKHLLVVKILLIKGEKFTFKASLEHKKDFANETVAVTLTPNHKMKPENVLNMVAVRGIYVSPDGKRVAVSLRQTAKETGKNESWLEILNTTNGKTIFSSKGLKRISRFKWLGNSTTFSYSTTAKKKTSIFKYDLNTFRQTAILKDIENFSSYWWAPNYSFLVYSKYHKAEGNDIYKYYNQIDDRSINSGYSYSMYLYYPTGGATHQLCDEEANYQDVEISPDNSKILFTKSEQDHKNRPYYRSYYYLFNINSLTVEKLFESNWVNSGQFSPDSKKLLMLGGPSAFDSLGSVLPIGTIPNDYDSQAYLYDLTTKKAEAISKQLNPSISNAFWGKSAKNIYFQVTDKSFRRVYKYSLKKKSYSAINMGVEVVHRISYAGNRNYAVYWGSSSNLPQKLYKINLNGGKGVLLKDYNKEDFQRVKLGAVKDWNFMTPKGKTIQGRIYYPVDFDSSKKYPCIVYYYGGTSPVTRDFGGRYPKNWYAANGYIVYVLQPSGATGFGQEFSTVHVNDWGKVTAEEVIGATKQLIKAHKYVDEKKLGAMGASYGGFLTMYIATQTDIFAGFISHAGISDLSSYWGVGDWGYTYSGVATADSFPWNRKDIYVGHSPLFMADRITTPLLLLHGDVDNNVPPGESYQMFAALKLMGKEVAMVTFKDQQHWILQYKKRLHWMRTIFAWWDKHLKKEPQHWEHLYQK